MEKGGVTKLNFFIFVIIFLFIFTIKSGVVLSSEEKSPTPPLTSEEIVGFGVGGVAKSTEKISFYKSININQITPEQIVDFEISKQLETNKWVPVTITLKDSSNITYDNAKTPKEKSDIYRQRREFNSKIQSEILSTLSSPDFKMEYLSSTGRGFGGEISREGLKKLEKNPNILKIYSPIKGDSVLQGSLPLINVDPDVWNLGFTGKDKTICVIDSGINYTHADLGGCSQTNNISDGSCNKVVGGFDFVNNDQDPMDDYGHGTYVAGIATANGNINGTAPDAKVVAIKVSNNQGTWIENDLADGIAWCNDKKDVYNISVITISLGSFTLYDSASTCDSLLAGIEINEAHNNGIFVDAASGNNGNSTHITHPGCVSNATSVGASTKSDVISSFTNRGDLLDLLAPGSSINSTRKDPNSCLAGCTCSGDYMVCSGTSAAAPHVAGAAALLLNKNSSLSPDEIKSLLKNTGINVDGYPRINVLAAIESIGGEIPGNYSSGTACNESGYEQCSQYQYGDCGVSIAVNFYDDNNIRWGEVNDSSDPFVINNYTLGWKGVDVSKMYYNVTNPANDCNEFGCSTGEQLAIEGTLASINAIGTAITGNILGQDNTTSYWCTTWFNEFEPNYGNNPIYVLNCYYDSDCSSNNFCNKTGSWENWKCNTKKLNSESCTLSSQCQSGYCDNDGVGVTDDNWCFTPIDTYFDSEDNDFCELSTGYGTEDCDEKEIGTDLNKCVGSSYYEDRCSSTCGYQDITGIFECTETDCSCSEPLCDGQTTGNSIITCFAGETYFADKCTSTAGGEDRGDNVCRSSAFASGCTADAECNGIIAGANGCSSTCENNPPSNSTTIYPNGAEIITNSVTINWTESTDPEGSYVRYLLDYSNNSGISWYNIISNYGYENKLNDSSTEKTLTYSGNENQTIYLRIPKTARVSSAKLNLTGIRLEDG